MKTGKSIVELAEELQRQSKAKKDFVADTRHVEMVMVGGDNATPDLYQDVAARMLDAEPQPARPVLDIKGAGFFEVDRHAHRQIGERLGVPARYYDKMMSNAPELLLSNVNHWLQNEPERRMVRTMDGRARAFLSDRYRPLDNYDLAEAVLPSLVDSGANIESCEITDSRMYIKAVCPDITAEIAPAGVTNYTWGKGHIPVDVVQPGLVITNSEIGMGALTVQPAIHTVRCTNLAVFREEGTRKAHLGRALGSGEQGVEQFYTDETMQLTQAAIWAQVRDLTAAALSGKVFEDLVTKLREARGAAIEGDPIKAVEVLTKQQRLPESEHNGILRHLLAGGEMSKYGLHDAITRFSQDVDDYDRATELEQLGATVIELPKRDWEVISQAA